jgi:Kef-type K+ transport system membrane component KefB
MMRNEVWSWLPFRARNCPARLANHQRHLIAARCDAISHSTYQHGGHIFLIAVPRAWHRDYIDIVFVSVATQCRQFRPRSPRILRFAGPSPARHHFWHPLSRLALHQRRATDCTNQLLRSNSSRLRRLVQKLRAGSHSNPTYLLTILPGGLSTDFQALKSNALLSLFVAITGIATPIALSFSLQGIVPATTPLQAFAAGAALCSTSLGTTFTVLSSSKLISTRLGVVLSGAAMMDDVVGLVMVSVITELGSAGGSDGGIDPVAVIRPVVVAVGFAIAVPALCWFIARPTTLWLNALRENRRQGRLQKILATQEAAFVIHTLILVGAVAAATYAGSSNLYAAYLAGAAISWWDSEVPHVGLATSAEQPANSRPSESDSDEVQEARSGHSRDADQSRDDESTSTAAKRRGTHIYEIYYQQPVDRVFKPLFFASIGFSIPITRMFDGAVVWRGVVYTILMVFSKLACGLWLVRFSASPWSWMVDRLRAMQPHNLSIAHFWGRTKMHEQQEKTAPDRQPGSQPPEEGVTNAVEASVSTPSTRRQPPRPLSLYPAAILGTAMVARGEIGFLVSSLASANGIFSNAGASQSHAAETSDIFLVVTWAIVLCTVVGPLGVGLLVRRVRRLEEKATHPSRSHGRTPDGQQHEASDGQVAGRGGVALGAWGVEGRGRG